MSYNTGKRRFNLLTADGRKMGCYTGSSPYQAASKAASKGHKDIMLREHFGHRQYGPKVHVYKGDMEPLAAHNHTSFTMRNQITHKPRVKKMGTIALANYDGVTREYGNMEDDCWDTPKDQCSTKPHCALHPSNGMCYWPDE